MPSRLIAVEGADRGSKTIFPLVDAKRGATYATLSYCWGGEQPWKLTAETLRTAPVFRWEELPKTILDAIKVTSGLGIPFLWVDSLCIVQDDPRSMAMEIDKMSEIYGNGVL